MVVAPYRKFHLGRTVSLRRLMSVTNGSASGKDVSWDLITFQLLLSSQDGMAKKDKAGIF